MNLSASIPRLLAALLMALAFALAPVAPGAVPPAGDPLGTAERRLAEGRADAAYALLQPLAGSRGGDTRFDYLLGLAALGSGRPAEAVEPLRRVLAAEPRFDAARLELARALARAGDAAAARAEYLRLQQQGASTLTRGIAARELALAAGAPAAGPGAGSATAAVEFAWSAGGGYDSNANAATSESAFFGLQLDPREQRQASPFAEVGAELRLRKLAADRPLRASAVLRAGHRLNPDAPDFDQSVVDGGVAIEGRTGLLQWSAALHATGGLLDGREHFTAPYAEVSASLPWRAGLEWVGLARAIALDYRQPDFEPLDVRRYVWGGALQTQDRAGGLPGLGVALLGGRDLTRDRGSPFSNDRWGARVFGARALRDGAVLYGELSWLTSDFFGARGFQRIDRLDRQWVGLVGIELRSWPAAGWSVGPQLRLTRHESNVDVFEYDRVEVSVFVRRALR